MKQMEEEKTMAMATVSKYKVSSYSNLVTKNDGHIFISVLMLKMYIYIQLL